MGGKVLEFVHLHNHTDYSLLDGAAPINKMVAKAKSFGMKHLAITDHGNMFGVLRFYKECKANDINPIIGCEFYVAPGSCTVKSSDSQNKYYHLILLAKNEIGYKNLLKLTSLSYIDGYYYKPRIDDDLLQKYSEGLICLSACIAGEIPKAIISGKYEEAKTKALLYRDIFGEDNFYFEVQDHGIPEQKKANEGLFKLSKELGIKVVATNDIHYIEKSHANAQDILICIGTGKKKAETKRMKFDSDNFYFKSPEEMAELFPNNPEVITNSIEIAEKCKLEITLPGPILPEYEIPAEFQSPEDYVRHITYNGLKENYGEITDEIRARADLELGVIFDMGFAGYFLIVWDFINYARQNDIPVGPGRGSGAGSIVAYGMHITDVDPLKYNLLFERFLNPDRISMPDFDVDFCFERRGEVIDYVTRKYGYDKVASICTFGTLKTKAVLKDVARVLDIPFDESNEISKIIPEGKTADGRKINVLVALEVEPRLQEYYNKGPIYKELFETAAILENMNRHVSTHACGMVIGKEVVTNYVPLYKDQKTNQISTEFTMDQLEECGLVKMDFLGLKTLTLIKNTERIVKKTKPDFSSEKIPDYDELTFNMLSEGKSSAIFQFESQGMQQILKQAKPNSLEDLIALNALYRPGPMQFIEQFVESKHGRQEIQYPHEKLIDILKPTYGVIVYQEQVMQVAQIIGGFSLGKADIMRRAMGKKKEKELVKMKEEFVQGAVVQGIDKKVADNIFEILKPFAGYGFNKSHAAAYSILAYKTAYLKAHFPAEFMAANLTNEMNSPDKFSLYLKEATDSGLKILTPDINLSDRDFSVVDGNIYYGLQGIKNVGEAAVNEIIKRRQELGFYENIFDFLEKVDLKVVNKRVLEAFIKSGVFDKTDSNRAKLMHNLDLVMDHMASKKASQLYGQTSLFEHSEEEIYPDPVLEEVEDWEFIEKLKFEKEYLGFFFSGHPLDPYKDIWKGATTLDLKRIESCLTTKNYVIVGIIKSPRQIVNKKGQPMSFATLEDFNGNIGLVLFSSNWHEYYHMLKEDNIVGIEGKVNFRGDTPSLIIEKILLPDQLKEKSTKEVHIKLHDKLDSDSLIELRNYISSNAGRGSLYLHAHDSLTKKVKVIRASGQLAISTSNHILDEIKKIPIVNDVWCV
ncbi:MAG: DNA polymerase III subunit alpha [Spirochaetales bacterium]|nr:DNA polymerase III subunit alpha [Spirochaetales bacterium]